MANTYFQFRQFLIHQDRSAMKVTTDGCLFGAWAAAKIMEQPRGTNVLDIGAGTGLTSLMIAQKNPAMRIDALEIEEAAASQARENAGASPWSGNVRIHHIDANHFTAPHVYDFIASNPPFYESELKPENSLKRLAHHEGLSFQALLNIIRKNLSPSGKFFLLLPYKRLGEMRRLATQEHLAIEVEVHVRQSPRHEFFRALIQGRHSMDGVKEANTIQSQLSIWDEDRNYSPEFTRLLREYYLHLM